MITVELNQDVFLPGQMVRGECHWQAPEQTRGQPALVTIGWRTEGRGDGEHNWYEQKITLVPQIAVPFEWEIPLKVPPSYDGELIRILWEVVVSTQRQDRLPREFGARLDAILKSDPKEIAIKPFRVVSPLALEQRT